MRTQLDDAMRAEGETPVVPKAGGFPHGDSAQQAPGDPHFGRVRMRRGVYAAVLIVTIGGVYLTTRTPSTPASPTAGHDHTAAAKGAPGGQPVALTAEQSRRIGVTYATAMVSPIESDVRTIGQITISTGTSRSRTICVSSRACWASFWPK